MSIVIDPTVPADSESPRLGAQRIRALTAQLLQLLGFTGSAAQTFATGFFASVNPSTGIPTLLTGTLTSGNPTSALMVANKQYVDSAVSGVVIPIGGGFLNATLAGNVSISNTPATVATLSATAPTGAASYRAFLSTTMFITSGVGSAIFSSQISDGTHNLPGPGWFFTGVGSTSVSGGFLWPVTTASGGSVTFTLSAATNSSNTATVNKTGGNFGLSTFFSVLFLPSA